MHPEIRVIACDLDNTLLNNSCRISDYTKHTFLRLAKQGYTIILATGRFYHETAHYIEQLQLEKFHGYVACCNGAQVYDIANGTIHTFDMMEIEEAETLMRLAQKHKLTLYIKLDQQYHLQVTEKLNHAVFLAKKTAHVLEPLAPFKVRPYIRRLLETNVANSCSELLDQKLYKICFLGSARQLGTYRREIHETFPGRYNFFDVTKQSMEIVRSTVSKAHAVEYICRQTGYTLQNVIAFGDSGNDEPLLEAAGIGITMKNGYGSTVRKATHVSAYTNEEDGVARQLNKLLK